MVIVIAASVLALVLAIQWSTRGALRTADHLTTGQLPTAQSIVERIAPGVPVIATARRDGFDGWIGAVKLSERTARRRSPGAIATAAHLATLAVLLGRSAARFGWAVTSLVARAGGIASLVVSAAVVAGVDGAHRFLLPVVGLWLAAAVVSLSVFRIVDRRARRALAELQLSEVLRREVAGAARLAWIGGLGTVALPPVPSPRWPAAVPGGSPGGHGPEGGWYGGSGYGSSGHDGGGGGHGGGGGDGGGGGAW